MTKKSFKKRYDLTEEQFYGKEEVGGSLYLNSVTSLPEGFNPTVGGSLDLSSVTSIPEGFNPTVGGSLDLRRGLTAQTQPYIPSKHKPKPQPILWQNGKFIMVDGIFTEVLMHRGNVWHVKKLNVTKSFYLVTDGEGNYAHGDTLKKAKEDLLFKVQSETLKNEPIYPDTVITINHYRLVTGACRAGVESWMQQHGIKKDKIKAKDLLPLLEKSNAFGVQKFKELMREKPC